MSTTVEIVTTPEVLGGQPRIEGKRVGVRMVGDMIRGGEWTTEEVIDELRLTRAEVSAALDYYDDHPDQMDQLRAEREAAIERIREQSRAPGT
jgi:uncharacterized protein (DUF433 family)